MRFHSEGAEKSNVATGNALATSNRKVVKCDGAAAALAALGYLGRQPFRGLPTDAGAELTAFA
jgi:hypothetical protein